MKNLDLNRVIQLHGLSPKDLAKELFPNNKHPRPALERVLTGEAFLDTNQLSKLSAITGTPIGKLFDNSEWSPKSSPDRITFTNGEYRAEIDTVRWISKVYHNESIFHETVILKPSISISEYLSEINELILKYK